ncbi:hypothetical protein [Serratia marcescens]|uniref:hypothetical protein n=1 Tax=Serratia marcescens TaxID=615 RepID=UPI00374E237E
MDYLRRDYSKNDIHPKFVPDSVRAFSRLSSSDMKERIKQLGETPVSGKKGMTDQYKKGLRRVLMS